MLSSLLDLGRAKNNHFRATHIDPYLRQVIECCRNEHIHAEAKELVPISELIQDNLNVIDGDTDFQDSLLPLVVDWFRSSFFRWFKAPNCEKCSMELIFADSYLNVERKRVEVYTCQKGDCDFNYEFVRHNDPAILLHTRTGRCGEWSICFLVILRALDYYTRIVFDSTDHVWNEVWSESRKKWIHVDPCEGVIDAPLLYEAGWGKKLMYCLAMSEYDVLDVTGRYVLDYNDTKARRDLCNEEWLVSYLEEVTQGLLTKIPTSDVKLQVESRRKLDCDYLKELMSKPQTAPDKSQLQGRKTGDIQWRLRRGEYSVSGKKKTVIRVSSAAPLNDGEIFSLKYSSDKNSYVCTDSQFNAKGWSTLVYEYENMDHKFEHDWKTSYLSRYESCAAALDGIIRWRLDLSGLNNKWQRLELVFRGKVYPETSINLSLISYSGCTSNDIIKNLKLELNKLVVIERMGEEVKIFDILVILSGDDMSDVAWQKPQLFRQTRCQDPNNWPFLISIF